MKRVKKIIATLLVFSIVLSIVACGQEKNSNLSSDVANTASSEKQVIRIGNFQNCVWNAQIMIAVHNGYFDEVFKDKGISVEVINFANGPAVNEAFIAGELDIVNGIGDQPIIVGMTNNVDTTILAGASKQGENIGIIAPSSANINSATDLKGKRIGVYVGTYVHKSLIGILNDAGISEDEVEIVNITSASDASAAFESGDIDAYLSMSGDYIYEKVNGEGFIKVADLSNHPAYSYIVADTKFVNDNQDTLDDFFKAIKKAEDWIKENPDEAYEALGEFAGMDPEAVKHTIKGADIQFEFDNDYKQNLLVTYDFLLSKDMITSTLTEDEIFSRIDTGISDKYAN